MNNKRISEMFDSLELAPELRDSADYDPERIKAAALRRVHAGAAARPGRRKLMRACLLAAVIACFLSVTAYALVSFGMDVHVSRPGETQTYALYVEDYKTGEIKPQGDITYQAALVLHFDSAEEGRDYYFIPGWLPSEPTETGSAYHVLLDQAADELGIKWPPEDGQLPAVEAKFKELAEARGLTEAESREWLRRCMDGDTEAHDIPYQISIYSPTDLYGRDLLLGANGEKVRLLSDREESGIRVLELTMEREGAEYPLAKVNYVLRYSLTEGWLLITGGTQDLETLAKIAGDVQIVSSDALIKAGEERSGASALGVAFG